MLFRGNMPTQRIVFEFLEDPEKEPGKWAKVKRIILDSGGSHLSEPKGSPPYILTAVLPSEALAREVIKLLRTASGVGQADLDVTREAF